MMEPISTDTMRYIWCSECSAIQPMLTDYLPASTLNSHAAMDLVCAECRIIVATLHELDK